MYQMKEQNKTLEKELNKMETSDLLDVEFKTLVIRLLKEFIIKKTRVRNEGYTNWNKEQFTGNQQ